MANFILAIDQGTTGTTCLVIDEQLNVRARGYREFPQHFPQAGWVEHDLEEIWESTRVATKAALEAGGIAGGDIAAIGITNQRETTGVWSKSGTPAHRAIVWQDRRTADTCARLKQEGAEETFRSKTGLLLDPYFSGTKLAWLLDEAGLRSKTDDLCFGTIDTWLVYKLTSGVAHVTDATNAARTLMFDIHNGAWDDDLLKQLGDIPSGLLPNVASSSEVYGKTKGLDFLPDDIPIAGIAGDQHAALFGQACFEPGMAKCTYGTGAFALVNTGDKPKASKNNLLTTIAWQLNGKRTYALEGSVFVAGAVVQWLRDQLGFFESSSEIETLAREVDSSDGVYVVPALTGLGAPHWRPDARGVICGLTRGSNRSHIARATLEGMAFQVFELLDAMREDLGQPLELLRVDGGASANDLLMQFQSDILSLRIHRPKVLDTTALGAACLAGLGVGIFSDLNDVKKAWQLDKEYNPSMPADEAAQRTEGWKAAVAKA